MTPIESFRSVLAPPHPVGRPFILGGIVAMLLGFLVGAWLAWLGALFTLFCLYFFRDPDRVPPLAARRRRGPGRWPRRVRRAGGAAG